MVKLTILRALNDYIISLERPVISDYQVFLLARELYNKGEYQGYKLHIKKNRILPSKGRELISDLVNLNKLVPDPDFHSSIYRVQNTPDQAAEEVCAIADPFCYISHLSAMQRYGLTSRLPAELCLTTPHYSKWKIMRNAKIREDYGDNISPQEIFPLKRAAFNERVRKRPVVRHEAQNLGDWRPIRDSSARVATIGRTFYDMLDKPKFCGGMAHVLEVWEEHAKTYLDEIIDTINLTEIKIIKARAGYILEELLKIKDARIKKWLIAAERGGSRVLDPEKPYKNIYSEKWMISLNV